jgi:glycosyltransferase involved in cell wall biosynthesis
MKKIKVAFIQYNEIGYSTGIGNVCEHLENELETYPDIILLKLKPPVLARSKNIIVRIINKILFEFWYLIIVPLRIYLAKADVYVEMNMLYPLCRSGKATFFFIHDLAFMIFPAMVTRRNHKRRLNFVRKLNNKDRFIVNSESTKRDLCCFTRIDPSRVTVSYLASSCKIVNRIKVVDGCEGYFLFVGTLEPRKNIVQLIKGFNQFLTETSMNYKLFLVGKMGWLSDDIMNTLNAYPDIKSNIVMIGYVTNEELSEYYSGAKALLFPSSYEGFGLPILEAMEHEIPVITCSNSSLREVGGDAAYYCEENAQSISEAMKLIASSPTLADDMIIKGKLQAQKFSWKMFGKCLHDMLITHLED